MEAQPEREALAQLLSEQYRVDAVKLELVYAVTPQKYTARDAGGAVWDVYVARTDAPGDNIYNGWLEGYSGHPVTDYLLDRAGLLLQLEAQQYPTQRVVRTYAGEVLGASGRLERAGDHLYDTRGRVRRAPVSRHGRGAGPPAYAERHAGRRAAGGYKLVLSGACPARSAALSGGRARLRAHGMASATRSFHDALGTIGRLPLPRALIHGDPYIDRAATADDGTLTFYEWHSGGEGVALLDLGRLLYGCHLDRDSRWPWSITPSEERIRAVMDGYQTRREAERHGAGQPVGGDPASGSAMAPRCTWPAVSPPVGRRTWNRSSRHASNGSRLAARSPPSHRKGCTTKAQSINDE